MKMPASLWLQTGLVAVALLVVTSCRADAYIDPGTGSFVLQAVLAGLLAVGFVLKSTWKNLTQAVGRLFGRNDSDAR